MTEQTQNVGAADVIAAATQQHEDGHQLTLQDVRRLMIQSGETLVIKTGTHLNQDQRHNVMEACAKVLPEGVNIMLLGPDWDMQVVAKEKEQADDNTATE